MAQNDAPVGRAQKLRGARQVEAAFRRGEYLTLRACELTQDVAASLANENLVELWTVANEGSGLDRYRLDTISATGLGLLAEHDVADSEPLRIAIELRHECFWKKLRQSVVSGIWDLIKIALGRVAGIGVRYFLWQYNWK